RAVEQPHGRDLRQRRVREVRGRGGGLLQDAEGERHDGRAGLPVDGTVHVLPQHRRDDRERRREGPQRRGLMSDRGDRLPVVLLDVLPVLAAAFRWGYLRYHALRKGGG